MIEVLISLAVIVVTSAIIFWTGERFAGASSKI